MIRTSCAMLLSTCLISSAFASAENTTNFSPYADTTLNTYWSSTYQDLEPADLIKVSHDSGVKSFHLAFITDAGSCKAAWGGQADYAVSQKWGQHLTDSMRAEHINYIVSFGGATGIDLSAACSEAQLLSSLNDVTNVYQPSGLDFDIENHTADVKKLMSALKQYQQSHSNIKISFTLPTEPTGLTPEGIAIINEAKVNNLNFVVNIMAMDYGTDYKTSTMGNYAIQAAKSLFQQLKSIYPTNSDTSIWKMIGVTPMIGVNDDASQQFTLDDVDTLKAFAQVTPLDSLAMWSIERDHPCADKWANIHCSGNNLQNSDYEFSKRFMKN